MGKRRKFERKPPERKIKKMFVVAAEGSKTEKQYFEGMFQYLNSVISVKCLKGNTHSSPKHVLKRMKKYLSEEKFLDIDEAWLVVDKDAWSDNQLKELYEWSKTESNYYFALSNPKFEYWLLLHFGPQECSERLKKYLPGYNKGVDVNKLNGGLLI